MDQPIEQLSPKQVQQKLVDASEQRPILLDCREPPEVAIARIDGATHIPMGEIPMQMNRLDAEREVIVFCHHGVRSYKVALFLKEQGFADVKNMRGGIDAWSAEIDPTIPRY